MIEVHFTRAPSHNWIGWCYYENGLYYSAGKTLDNLLHRIKNNLYGAKRVSNRQVMLATKPSDISDVPLEKIGQMFKSKYWYEKNPDGTRIDPKPTTITPTQTTEYDYYDTKMEDGNVLVVYGVVRKEVARYPLGNMISLSPTPKHPLDVTPFGNPAQPFGQPQVRYDGGNDEGQGC